MSKKKPGWLYYIIMAALSTLCIMWGIRNFVTALDCMDRGGYASWSPITYCMEKR